MGVTVTPPVRAANLADNPKNRLYRATQSGTYSVSIPVGVYEVTRQATTNIIIGSTTIVPSTMMSILFVNEPQTSITFNSTISSLTVPWSTASVTGRPAPTELHFLNGTYILSPAGGFVYSISTDGITWVNRTAYGGNDEGNSWGMDYGLGRFVVPLEGGPSGANKIRTTTDLISWGGVGGAPDRRWFGCKFGNGLFVLAGANNAYNACYISTSTNGTTWNSANDIYIGGPEHLYAIQFANGLFVVGGTLGSVWSSTNGTTWTYRQSNFGLNAINKIAFGNGIFMAVGANGTIGVSTDGATWQLRPLGETPNVTNVVYNPDDNIFAISWGTSIRYSTNNGVTWTARNAQEAIANKTLLYANGQYFYGNSIDGTSQRVYRVARAGLTTPSQTVPFTDTYIILDYKGTTRTLP